MKLPYRLQPIEALRRFSQAGSWHLRLMYWLSGTPSVIWFGIASSVVLAGYYYAEVLPLEERTIQLRRDTAELVRIAGSSPSGPRDPATQLASFYSSMPTPGDVPDAMQTLFDAMQEEGLSQEQASFELQRASGDRFVRYQLSLPFKGTYPQLRRFLAKLIAALPTLAVDDIQFTRAQVADAVVECRLSLTLYLIDRGGAR